MKSKDCLNLLMFSQTKVKNEYEFVNSKTKERLSIDDCYEIIIKDLEILECFRKIPKQDLENFIDEQIRYEINLNSWLKSCNCDLEKEELTKHLIKIKEWLERELENVD